MFEVTIPLLNPNEPEAILAGLHIQEGQNVVKGMILATLETTKSTADLVAESDGYVTGLRFQQGQMVSAGEILCYLADEPHPEMSVQAPTAPMKDEEGWPVGVRMTRPAQVLARQLNLDPGRLPVGPLITEETIRGLAEESYPLKSDSVFDPTAIVVYGGGGHGKSLVELLRLLGVYHIAGFIDDGLPKGSTISGLPVLGGGECLPNLAAQGVRLAVNAVGGIGNLAVRIRVFKRLAEAGFACPAVVHPTAFMEASARLAGGVQVLPHAYVGSDVQVGFGSIINTGAIVSHDCKLGELVNLSPGAILAGEVEVGDGALIGMGVTVNLRVKIGAGARIGNSATVKADVPTNGLVRAGFIWPPAT